MVLSYTTHILVSWILHSVCLRFLYIALKPLWKPWNYQFETAVRIIQVFTTSILTVIFFRRVSLYCTSHLSFETMVTEIKYQNFNISYNLWQVLYCLNLFNILYVDCPAFPFHTVYSLTKLWEERYWPASKTTKYWSWKRKGQNFQNPLSYFIFFRNFKNLRKYPWFYVILRMSN